MSTLQISSLSPSPLLKESSNAQNRTASAVPDEEAQSSGSEQNPCSKRTRWVVIVVVWLLVHVLVVLVIFLVFRPKLPKLSINGITIQKFQISEEGNNTLTTELLLNITLRNPNKKIGIYYQGGNKIRLSHQGYKLCEGYLPKFYQGNRNSTSFILKLTGQTPSGTQVLQSMQLQRNQTGVIRLSNRAKVATKLKVMNMKSIMKTKFLMTGRVTVQNVTIGPLNITQSSQKTKLQMF